MLVDERDLWPDGEFVTTNIIVRTEYLEQNPETVEALLRGHVAAVQLATDDPDAAKAAVNAGLEAAGSSALDAEVLDRAWGNLTVTWDPLAATLEESAQHSFDAGTTPELVDIEGIYDLRPLNAVLSDLDLEPVDRRRPGRGLTSRPGGHAMATEQLTRRRPRRVLPAAGPVPPALPPAVRVTGVSQVFERGRPPVLDGVDLTVAPGEFVCLVGASGCGKSTLLNLVAGLVEPTAGEVEVSAQRPALMFQEPALLPWLTASGNVELALRARGVGRAERRTEAARLLCAGQPLRARPASGCTSCPGACASASPWPGRWPRTARCCSWTSRSPRSTRSPATCSTSSWPGSGPSSSCRSCS